ncbi:type I DNA topoisomerase [Pumilibacter intestinalis]|uniref:type I DNA topoisomerase n=1 Tax=Pumilibacter intestinalis TaxID=2941511 RepID=UPI00203F206F|nr:type I DNA topoisomerase [Pumilibacter intestinalis]
MKLVIIEGIGKKETVEKYLGSGYKVFATKGHVRDLPTKTLAVNVKKDFEPKYVIMDDKKEVVEQLKSAVSKADEVLLATDPDREGEAISWHVANILGIPADSPVRIEFNEISKKAVQNALKHPRAIDINLVDAQQARRVLDRLVGYKLSPVLCKKIQNKLSAGRVQSVTLRLVVEREREILNFKPEEYWPFFSVLENQSKVTVKAALSSRGKQKFKIPNEQVLKEVISELDGKEYEVTNVKRSVTKSKPPAPFITSTMQQDAQNKLGMSSKQTSSTAQTLYEGIDLPGEGKVALVTYIRTDSTRVADDAVREARAFISAKFGEKFIPAKPNVYKSKKGAQDAHEAIRPISLERTPESIKDSVNKYQYKLYKLIYDRFMASQMSEATYNSLAVDIAAGNYGFKVNGKSPLFAGYTAVYNMYTENKDEDESSDKLPNFEVGEKLGFKEYKYEQKFTKPPARFTEASLVKMMDEEGIGRPATYTPTVTLLSARNYIEPEGKYLKPTQLGMDVTDMLVKYFPEIMDVKFTADMEKRLDEIEDGGVIWQRVVGDFYNGFEEKISSALGDSFSLKAPDQKTDVACPTCGTLMVVKSGRFGKFLACPNYPKCRTTLPYDEETGKPATPQSSAPAQETDVKCSKCGRTMVLKQGKFGPFLACPGYPECKNIVNIESKDDGKPDIPSAPCPKCGKPMKKIVSRGSAFYGCTGYPECRFTANAPLAEGKCPECGSPLLIRSYKDGTYHVCSSKTCKYKTKAEA